MWRSCTILVIDTETIDVTVRAPVLDETFREPVR